MKVEKSGGMTIGGVIEGERLKVVGQGCSAKAAASTGLAWRSPSCADVKNSMNTCSGLYV